MISITPPTALEQGGAWMKQPLELNHCRAHLHIPNPATVNHVRAFQRGGKKKINISSILPGVSCPARSSSARKVLPESQLIVLIQPTDG